MRHLCAVCETDAAARNVQTGGWRQSFSVGMVLPCRNTGKMAKKSGKMEKIIGLFRLFCIYIVVLLFVIVVGRFVRPFF
jgi:hypothetical protein